MSMITPPDSPCLTGAAPRDPRKGRIIANSFKLIDVLGVGAYGTVYKARDLVTGHFYAVKALNKVGLDQRQQRFQRREIDLHYQASAHPNVLSMHKIVASPECTYVLLDYCPEGDLFAKITEQGHYIGNDRAASSVFLQLLEAVQHCHNLGIYHRDLKPENIMVTNDGLSIKLADFGLATRDEISQDFGCGSTFYMSPECQNPDPQLGASYYSAPNDIWALGVVLINLTCGRNPWKRASPSDSTYKAFRKNRDFLKTILPISDQLNYVLQRIFEENPVKRIQLPELIERMRTIRSLTVSEKPITPPTTPEHNPACDTSVYPSGNSALVQELQPVTDNNVQLDGMMDIDIVPTLHLPSPLYAEPLPAGYGSATTQQYQLPPSPPSSNRSSMVDFPYDTNQSGGQVLPGYPVDPSYNFYYNADVAQWNNYAHCYQPHWPHQQFAPHYAVY